SSRLGPCYAIPGRRAQAGDSGVTGRALVERTSSSGLRALAPRSWCGVLVLGAALLAGPAQATTYTVTLATDTGANNELRWAINKANTHPGADVIDFAIPGAGVHTITLTSALPAITDAVTIDGTTQPGYAGSPLIEIKGPGGGAAAALDLQPGSSGST